MLRRDFLGVAAAAPLVPSLALAGAAQGAGTADLRFRQVHLDFHTSEQIRGIGDAFDPEEFAATLQKARVNSVTCFARCHHGWIYYDTKAHPERHHPHLRRNLLKEQIEACHKRNIRVPIYTTIQWDHYTATRHPEWLVLDEKGAPVGNSTYEPGFYRRLCVNTPYRQFLESHVKDLLTSVATDGLFFDIVSPMDCSCRYCREKMQAAGLDPSDQATRKRFGLETINGWKHEMTAFVRGINRDCTIFYNAGHIGPRHRAVAPAYTHFELESLPSGGWGYMDFPLKVRYTRTLGIQSLGMTGKFHTSWGDFHSFKNPAALQFECFQMLALGAKCSVGDQLHPTGKIDPYTYQLIGSVYAEVEKKEPW
ncbi:MAG TPA: alpha-L-fucosidase, partial [Bryobacteraceae bacterium]|nr:alpha-L-fucosidase [Bryobacteraceae bacterium]